MPDPKRPTKEEALPHTMDPPKPLTAEELDRCAESVYGRNDEWNCNHVEISQEDWLGIRATIDHLTRRAEAAEERLRMHHPKEEIS